VFTDLVGMPYWAGALVFAAVLVVILVMLERWRPWRTELGRDVDGDLSAPSSEQRVHARIVPAE
jgi:uncharacterized protein